MKFLLMLNKVKEHLTTPHLTFTQIFQLQRYGQYGLHGSIVNVPTNLIIIQTILLQMPHENYSISVFLKYIYIQIYLYGKLCSA
jgi:hypothetical protein